MRDIFYGDIYAAARALVGLSQIELAERARLERRIIMRIEKISPADTKNVELHQLQVVRRVLEAAGARFIPAGNGVGEGVCRAQPYDGLAEHSEPSVE